MLNIYVAERTSESVHRVPNLNTRSINTEIDIILQGSISGRWGVVQGDGARNGVLSVLQILVLPDPPCAVDLRVMKEESWVSWGGEDVSTGIASDGEVATSVYAAVGKMWSVPPHLREAKQFNLLEPSCKISLHSGLEGANVGVLCDQVGRVLIRVPLQVDYQYCTEDKGFSEAYL